MNLEQLAEKYLPYTKEDRDCVIKRGKKDALRDAFKYEVAEYIGIQLQALQRAQTPKKEYV